jgi:hypothetical protein
MVLDPANGLAGTGKRVPCPRRKQVAPQGSRLSRAVGSMGMGEILPPEFGVLLVGQVKSDLASLALNHYGPLR